MEKIKLSQPFEEILNNIVPIIATGTGTFDVRELKIDLGTVGRLHYDCELYIASTDLARYIRENYPHLVTTDPYVFKGRIFKKLTHPQGTWTKRHIKRIENLGNYYPKFDGQLTYVGNNGKGISIYEVKK